jgi:hypothetical protein
LARVRLIGYDLHISWKGIKLSVASHDTQ